MTQEKNIAYRGDVLLVRDDFIRDWIPKSVWNNP